MIKVLFVGSFKNQSKDGSVGGQMFASRSLINAKLMQDIDFIKIDTTAVSVPAPAVYKRIPYALRRMVLFIYYMLFYRIKTCLIFSSAGFSFMEKGLMVFIGYYLSKKVIFAPRSGLIEDDVQNSKFKRWLVAAVIRKSDYVICQGQKWKSFYQKFDQPDDRKFIVIPNWLNVDDYADNSLYHTSVNGSLNILYLGWLERYKGIFDLIEASAILKQKGRGFTVNIYGSGKEEARAKGLITEKNLEHTVFLKGWADFSTKMKALKDADIFVLPSHKEGFPNALLEAMSCGLPVVATKVGGVNDIVDQGRNGLLIESGDVKGLSEAMDKLISDEELRKRIGKEARKTTFENNHVEKVALTIKKIIIDR